MAVHTRSNIARLHLPRKEGGEGWLVLRSVLRRSSNPCMAAWGIAQSGCCRWFWKRRCLLKKRIFRTTRGEGKRRNEATAEKKPYMESLLAMFKCGWRGVLEIAQECFFKEGNRGLDPRCSTTSFKNKFGQAQHIQVIWDTTVQIVRWIHRNSMAYCQCMQEACPEGIQIQEASRQGGSTCSLGAMQKVCVRV